jgi:tRNA pseudouridine55 synthase
MAMTIMARSRRKGLPINGWLCLDKPQGMTSTSAVGFVRRVTGAAKAGHGGTLDPLATGVLPIAFGEATKTVSYVMDGEKHYRFTIRLGQATATDDSEGEVIAESDQRPATAAIEAALCRFIGTIEQVPPCFAAVKVAGERAYDLARRGEVVELEARSVRVRDLRLVERRDDEHATFDLISGKGVYVRSIARDLGRLLGCQAHVVELRRLKVGAFEAAHAVTPQTLERLVGDDAFPQVLRPLKDALMALPSVALTGPQALRLRAGQSIRVAPHLVVGNDEHEDAVIRAMAAGDVVALARLDGAELSPLRVFNLSSPNQNHPMVSQLKASVG